MNYLIDTCVISELIKKEPDANLLNWLSSVNENNLYLSVITIGELKKGISKLKDSEKKSKLNQWLKQDLFLRFNNRIIDINLDITLIWGEILGEKEASGLKIPLIDALLAATAISKQMILVTRNIKDFKLTNSRLLNPWEEQTTICD